jgi:AcrR family transcriptional regulator
MSSRGTCETWRKKNRVMKVAEHPPVSENDTAAAGPNDDKARQILDGARRVFLRDGFDGASMNDIVRAAGVSKGTLYVYYPSKEALFAALIRHDKRQQAEQTCKWAWDALDVREALMRVGRSFISMMARPDHVAQVRTVMAVAPKFPEIGRAFYEAGPLHGTDKLERLITHYVARGEIATDDPRRAAVHFTQLCQGDLYRRLMFCIGDTFAASEIEETITAAVDVFLRAHTVTPR